MKKERKMWMMMTIVILFTFLALGCPASGGDGDPTSITYTSTDGDTSYTLRIDKNPARSAFVPVAGDSYILTIRKAGEADRVSSGIVESTIDKDFFFLKPSNGISFYVMTYGNNLFVISGPITLTDGSTIPGPDDNW